MKKMDMDFVLRTVGRYARKLSRGTTQEVATLRQRFDDFCRGLSDDDVDGLERRTVRGAIRAAQAPLLQRISDLESRSLQKGDPGKDAPAITDAQLDAAVVRYLTSHPPPKGDKGDPGQNGNPGKDGAPGRDAEPVSLTEVVRELLGCDELRSLVELRVKESVAAIPAPKDGQPGPRGEPGQKGDPGDKGADGVGLSGFLIDRDGILVATTSKGEAVRLGAVVGKDGAPGKDGRDGLGFEDVEFEYDGERTVKAKFVRGGSVLKEVPWRFPVIIDRGYWKQGFRAEKGDAVTHDGTLWIALRDNQVKPSLETKEDWRVGVRKGRDAAPVKLS